MQNAITPPKIFASINQQSISPETLELIDYIFTGGNPARIAPTAYPESSQRLEESSQSRFRIFSCWLPCLSNKLVEEDYVRYVQYDQSDHYY
jgi:hypothetical protein